MEKKMKRKNKQMCILFLLLIELAIGIVMIQSAKTNNLDMVKVNELYQDCIINWDNLKKKDRNNAPSSYYKYTIWDKSGELLYASDLEVSKTWYESIRNRDTIIDLFMDNEVVGKLIIYNETSQNVFAMGKRLFLLLLIGNGIGSIFFLAYIWYLKKNVFLPFQKLKQFASRIANGNLELPLEMDKNNIFGAFTESFDIMREELKKAKEQERLANQSKKELVAQLSHDIKTPVSSIRAISEVMMIQVENEKIKQQLAIIETKADQIDALISNLFHGTLEELQELKVEAKEQDSNYIFGLLVAADYQKRAIIKEIPGCFVWFDTLRLQQVFDNLFVNSYKYADTKIEVTSFFESNMLVICFRDYGLGVLENELPFLFTKFYRGKNAIGKSGAGLGLSISYYLLEQMGGFLECENLEDGFCVSVKLKI